MSESVTKLFKSGISIFHSLMGHLDISHTGFQSQVFRGLIFLMQVPSIGIPDVGQEALPPQVEAPYFLDPSEFGVSILRMEILTRHLPFPWPFSPLL